MSELRAPDPTLTASDLGMVGVEVTHGRRTAHRIDVDCDEGWRKERMVCGKWLNVHAVAEREVARWVAVPCRECFPDAPPPGARQWSGPNGLGAGYTTDPNLGWQVTA